MSDGKSENALAMIIENSQQLQKDGPGPGRVLIMSGTPLSGKSHMVNLIEKRAPGGFLLVRSDEVRPIVAKCLGRKRPAYDDIEHATTFIVAGEVVRSGLTLNWPVIIDATNLREEFRNWAYLAADDLKAEIVVVFMQVTDEVAMFRLSERDRSGSAATFNVYEKLKYEQESIGKCTRPCVVINSEGDMRPYAKNLANWLTGKADTIPGLKKPSIKKIYSSDPEEAPKEMEDIFVSRPYWKSQREETLPEATAQLPVPEKAPEPPKLKIIHEGEKKPKGAKRIVYDFYTGEEIEVDD